MALSQLPADGATVALVWQRLEIVLAAENSYASPSADVVVWVDLQGPDFSKRVYGF